MSIRVLCQQCKNKFRAEVYKAWAIPPVYGKPHPETGIKPLIEPGRHEAKHTLCRNCFKQQNYKARPKPNIPSTTVRVKPVKFPPTPVASKPQGKRGK
jgi:hypothetical protein